MISTASVSRIYSFESTLINFAQISLLIEQGLYNLHVVFQASEHSAHHPIASPLQQLSVPQQLQNISSDPSSSDYNENLLDDFSDIDDWFEDEIEVHDACLMP